MDAATLDEHVPFASPIYDFLQDSSRNFQGRLVQIAGLELEASHPRPSHWPYCPPSMRSTSSMAPAVHQPRASNASDLAPSLHYCPTITESSVSTGIVDQCAGYPLLVEDVDGVLLQPDLEVYTPDFGCVFWFLNCEYISRDEEEWKTHCLSHFYGEDPPRSVSCPLCDWEISLDRGTEAWASKMQHLADKHFRYGQNLSASRPDFHLYTHLWQKRLIDDQDLKELKGGNHNLTREPSNFVRMYGPQSRRDRDERNGRRRRLQHIPEGPARRS